MATTKFTPPAVPSQDVSRGLRVYLDDQMRRLQTLVNNSAQVSGNETISGDWTFTGATVVPEATVTDHQAALSIAGEQIDSGTISDAQLSSNVPLLDANNDFQNTIGASTANNRFGGSDVGTYIGIANDLSGTGSSTFVGRASALSGYTNGDLVLQSGGGTVWVVSGTTKVAEFSSGTTVLTATTLDFNGNVDISGTVTFPGILNADGGLRLVTPGNLKMEGRSAAGSDIAGFGQLWVKNTSPTQLWFTDDAGNDTRIV